MGSNGGVLSVDRTCRQPIALVESGPIGGCIGAGAYAEALGYRERRSRSTWAARPRSARWSRTAASPSSRCTTRPVTSRASRSSRRSIDIVEVGSGGGSIAWLDAQKRLHVGPRSAGSTPGPVCYGRGGTEPTVTDANLRARPASTPSIFSAASWRSIVDAASDAIARTHRANRSVTRARRLLRTGGRHHRDRDRHDGRRDPPRLGRARPRSARLRAVLPTAAADRCTRRRSRASCRFRR